MMLPLLRQLAAFVPLLQLDPKSANKYMKTINWLIQLAAFAVLASHIKIGNRGLRKMIRQALLPTTYITSGAAYHWVSTYISQDPDVMKQLRDRIISAEDEEVHDDQHRKRMSTLVKRKDKAWSKNGVIAVVRPLLNQELVVRYQNRKFWVTKTGSISGGHKWCIVTWYWNRHLVDDFIVTAYKLQHVKTDEELLIYSHTLTGSWSNPARRPKRSWGSVILPAKVKEDLLSDVERFMSDDEKEWYNSKGIPHRRGYLLYGPPGTGKTTLATALASKLGLNLYRVNPGAAGISMDDVKLERYFASCPPGSLLFIEDIDCVLPKRDPGSSNHSKSRVAKVASSRSLSSRMTASESSVTLSGLLNAIDGICSQEDSVLFASTNHLDELDEALRRPGRFDVHVKFEYATHEQVTGLFKHFYAPIDPSGPVLTTGMPSSKPAFLTEEELDQAALQFANVVIEADVDISVASIQGYLLLHKKDPRMAVERADDWVKGIGTGSSKHAVDSEKPEE